MAGVTSAIAGGLGAVGSIMGSNSAASAQKKQFKLAKKQWEESLFRNLNVNGPGGTFGSYDPTTGQINTQLGDRLTGQLGQVDQFANMFANQTGSNPLAGAFGTLGQMQGVAGMQPQTNPGLFSGLQGLTQGNLGISNMNVGAAARDALNLSQFGNQAFGIAGQQLAGIGTGEQARDRQLDLLRQQAQPFEQRAFSDLQDNQFATGRLGSSGGALQTEAFARGLGQADLSRQLAASQEGRAVQNNALGLAQGAYGLGAGQRNLSQGLLNQAFSNFGGMANLAGNIEEGRFGQQMRGQQNLFNQLGTILGDQSQLAGQGQALQGQNFQNFLSALGAGQSINQIPMDQLNNALRFEMARSRAASGAAQGQADLIGPAANQGNFLASAFSGLGQLGQSGMLDGLFNRSSNTGFNVGGPQSFQFSPTSFGGPGPLMSSMGGGFNPFQNFGGAPQFGMTGFGGAPTAQQLFPIG